LGIWKVFRGCEERFAAFRLGLGGEDAALRQDGGERELVEADQ
jgi:hypothetical protein